MVQWNDGFSLGLKILDDDHKKLLETINKFSDAIDRDASSYEYETIFIELEKYVTTHFYREESYLKKCNYKYFDEHQKQHQSFSEQIPELKEKFFLSDNYIDKKEMVSFLTDWLINHIITEDIPLINTFEDYGFSDKKEHEKPWFTKLINNISFKKRMLLSAIIPLIGMLIFSSIIIINDYEKYLKIKQISKITHTVFNINELSHSLQIERGLSSGYISAINNKFLDHLNDQRKISDRIKIKFITDLSVLNLEKNDPILESLEIFKKDIISLNRIRELVDNKTISITEEFDFYTKIIKNIIQITSKITLINSNKDISYALSTLSAIFHIKELSGQERAYGTVIIEHKGARKEEYKKFLKLIGSKESYYDLFNQTAKVEHKNMLDSLMTTSIANDISEYTTKILNKKYENLKSEIWFDLKTKNINNINEFMNSYKEEIHTMIESNLDIAENNIKLWLLYIFVILGITITIMYIFNKSTMKQFTEIISALKHLSLGDRYLRLKNDNTKDEIHQIYDAYEVTRQKLLKADIVMQLYLSQEKVKLNYEKRMNKQLEEEVIHDGLTHLFNRRYFDEIIKKELMRAKRDKIFFTFVMLDIDFFKQYNDTYGHQAGDKTLKAVANVLNQKLSRGGDFCFRLGGEEFGYFFVGKSLEESTKYTKEICKEIEKLKILHSKNKASKYVTASFGLVNLDMNSYIFDENTIYLSADKALYEAKERGRNQVVVHVDSEIGKNLLT